MTRTSLSRSCTSRSCGSTTTSWTGCGRTSPSARASATSSPALGSSCAGTYQWLCVHAYLAKVLNPGTVDEVLASEDDLLGLAARGRAVHAARVLGGRLPLRAQHDPRRLRLEPELRRSRDRSSERIAWPALRLHRHGRLRASGHDPAVERPATLPDNWPAEWDRLVDSTRPSRSARRAPSTPSSPGLCTTWRTSWSVRRKRALPTAISRCCSSIWPGGTSCAGSGSASRRGRRWPERWASRC